MKYAKVRADEAVIGLGRGVPVQRAKRNRLEVSSCCGAQDSNSLGSLVWLTLTQGGGRLQS